MCHRLVNLILSLNLNLEIYKEDERIIEGSSGHCNSLEEDEVPKRCSDPTSHVTAMHRYYNLKSDLRIKNNLKLLILSRGSVRLYENTSSVCASYSTDSSTSVMYGTDYSASNKYGSTSNKYGTDSSTSTKYGTDYSNST